MRRNGGMPGQVKIFHIIDVLRVCDTLLDDHQALALMAAQMRLKMKPSLSRRTWNGTSPYQEILGHQSADDALISPAA